MLKACTRRGYVKLDNDVATLQRAIEYLKQPKEERQTRQQQERPDLELQHLEQAVAEGADSRNGSGQSPEASHEGGEVRDV